MPRTTLCVVTALVLAALSLAIMTTRRVVLGDDARVPIAPGIWKVTLAVQGVNQGAGRITTAAPLDIGRQHVVRESFRSVQMASKYSKVHQSTQRRVLWTARPGFMNGPVRLRGEFLLALQVAHPNALMGRTAAGLYSPPHPGQYLDAALLSGPDGTKVGEVARRIAAPFDNPIDVAEALFHFVDRDIANEPTVDGRSMEAATCLQQTSGDNTAKSRLLTALLRKRGIPARLVTGLTLSKGAAQRAHTWVEAWVHDRWVPMCPFWHQFGRVTATYLIFGFGDFPIVRGRNVKDLDYAFAIERVQVEQPDPSTVSRARQFFDAISLYRLPPGERRVVELLLLLPVAALIICLFRNVIGLPSFGTFAPALIGLAFRELHSLPGILIFAAILLIGWVLRRALDPYHLLQVPRIAVTLSLITSVLIGLIVAANHYGAAATTYIALFPMIILTGMVERFWTLEVEDGTSASFKTLAQTLFIATVIALVLSLHALVRQLFRYPETLGLVMAAQLLIGRYTGYRLMELWRFRDLIKGPPASQPSYVASGEA
jgi:hypothetical protein